MRRHSLPQTTTSPEVVNLFARDKILPTVMLYGAIGILVYNISALLIPMATSSLWNDEFYSVVEFASKGPVQVITDYHVPNNHIFFNLFNSLIPGSTSLHPLRARAISLAAILVFALIGVKLAAKRTSMWQGVVLLLLLLCPPFLELMMQARGYGLLALSAVLHCLLVRQYVRNRKPSNLWLIVLVTILGTWTVPSYLFFAAPIHALLVVYNRDLLSFVAGAVAASSVAIVYAPVLPELLQASSGYRGLHGAQFNSFASLAVIAADYLRIQTAWYQIVLVGIIVSGIFWTVKADRAAHSILLFSCIFALIIILILQTPLTRTVAFLLVPGAFLLGGAVQAGSMYVPSLQYMRDSLLLILLAAGMTVHLHREPDYIPIESWKQIAEFINEKYPESTRLYVPFRYHQLEPYLTKDFERIRKFNQLDFDSGQTIVIENKYSTKSLSEVDLSAPFMRRHSFPQQRGGAQVIYWVEQNEPSDE